MDDRVRSAPRRSDAKPFGDRGNGVFSLRLARHPQAVAFARQNLRRWLERDGVSREDALEIALACSEACANAIQHADAPDGQPIEVEAKLRPEELELFVRDFGSWSEAAPSNTRGRGLQMIRAIMDEVDLIRSVDGTTVFMRRSLNRGSE